MTGVYGDDDRFLNYFSFKNPLTFHGYSSFDEMIAVLESADLSGISSSSSRATGWAKGQQSFLGTSSLKEALNLAKFGWPEGAALAEEISQTMNTEFAKSKKSINSMVGSSVNVPRMLSGNPIHMRKKQQKEKAKIVTVFVNCAMLASVDKNVSNFKACVICGLIDLLERNGFRCELIAVTTSNTRIGRGGFQSATVIKNSGEKLNIENAVFTLGHASFFRRFCFTLNGITPECETLWSYMGITAKSFDEKNPTKKNEIYIDHLTPDLSDQIRMTTNQTEKIKLVLHGLSKIKVSLA